MDELICFTARAQTGIGHELVEAYLLVRIGYGHFVVDTLRPGGKALTLAWECAALLTVLPVVAALTVLVSTLTLLIAAALVVIGALLTGLVAAFLLAVAVLALLIAALVVVWTLLTGLVATFLLAVAVLALLVAALVVIGTLLIAALTVAALVVIGALLAGLVASIFLIGIILRAFGHRSGSTLGGSVIVIVMEIWTRAVTTLVVVVAVVASLAVLIATLALLIAALTVATLVIVVTVVASLTVVVRTLLVIPIIVFRMCTLSRSLPMAAIVGSRCSTCIVRTCVLLRICAGHAVFPYTWALWFLFVGLHDLLQCNFFKSLVPLGKFFLTLRIYKYQVETYFPVGPSGL